MEKRRSFAESFADALRVSAAKRGWRAYVPHVLLICLGLGAGGAYAVEAAFWSTEKWDVAATVYGGLLAFNALLLAVGWSAFSKIYEVISRGRLGEVLLKNKLLDEHLF